jgi:hypothetical protein
MDMAEKDVQSWRVKVLKGKLLEQNMERLMVLHYHLAAVMELEKELERWQKVYPSERRII